MKTTNNDPPSVVEIRYTSVRTLRVGTERLASMTGENMLDIEKSIDDGALQEWLELYADPSVMEFANVTEEGWQGRVMTATWD